MKGYVWRDAWKVLVFVDKTLCPVLPRFTSFVFFGGGFIPRIPGTFEARAESFYDDPKEITLVDCINQLSEEFFSVMTSFEGPRHLFTDEQSDPSSRRSKCGGGIELIRDTSPRQRLSTNYERYCPKNRVILLKLILSTGSFTYAINRT